MNVTFSAVFAKMKQEHQHILKPNHHTFWDINPIHAHGQVNAHTLPKVGSMATFPLQLVNTIVRWVIEITGT